MVPEGLGGLRWGGRACGGANVCPVVDAVFCYEACDVVGKVF